MILDNLKNKIYIRARRALTKATMRKAKVFAIGFNKSGTTSLDSLFKTLGLSSYHGVEWRRCDDVELLNSYDCFSDGIPQDLAKLDVLFPGSRYILQVRGLEGWLHSRLEHIDRAKSNNTYKENSHWDTTEYAIKYWIKQRNEHHLFVLSYFA